MGRRKKEQTLAAEFGGRMRRLRKHNDWTQNDLADRLDVTVSQVSRWEAGKMLPITEIQIDICDVFNVSMDFMLRGIGDVRGQAVVDADLREQTGIIEQLPIQYRNETREVQRSIIAKARQDGVGEPMIRAELAPTPKAARR